jgi:predicted acyltransferase
MFAIGVLLNLWLPSAMVLLHMDVNKMDSFVLMGTLQRIALAYLFAAVVLLRVKDFRKQFGLVLGMVTAYTSFFFVAPAPGFSPGELGAQGNAVSYIDTLILRGMSNTNHPLLNTVPAGAMVLLGTMAGRLLSGSTRNITKLKIILASGILLLAGGFALSQWIPINFRLWSISYIFITGGIAYLCFGLFYWALEIKNFHQGIKPLQILGMNPIIVWVVAEVLRNLLQAKGLTNHSGEWSSLWTITFDALSIESVPSEVNSIIFALVFACLLYVVSYILYRQKAIIRIS